MIKLYVRYDKLNKWWEYQISNEKYGYYEQWIWFYVGKYLRKRVRICPYFYSSDYGKSKLMREYKCVYPANQIAKWIVAKIENHASKVKKEGASNGQD